MIRDEDIAQFVAQLRARLAAGARQYGNRSFERPLAEVVEEIEQELLDVAGWGLIAWTRLQRVRAAVERVDREGHDE